jgi:predicted enzyme related to lactoylglutathione lyase
MIDAPSFVPLNGDPSMEAVDVRGKFVWHQLMTRDVPGAKKFYSRLTGWKMQPWPPDPNYTVCHSDAGPAAGIMTIPAEMPADVPAHWLQYIGTRDVDGTADAAVRAGGSVMKAPSDMQGAGRYAVIKDPQGAMFAILDPENARPEIVGVPPDGTFSWHELATSDNEAAFAFYSALFGWDAITRMDMGPIGTYLIFGWNGQQRGGMYISPANTPLPPNWLPYVSVPNADAGFAQATSNGAKELFGPMEVPGGSRVAAFMDPAGATFAVHSMPAGGEMKPEAAPARPKPKTKPKTKPKAKTKVTAKPKPKAKATPKPKPKSKAKPKTVPKRKVARKAAAKKKKPVKKVANQARARKSKTKLKSKQGRRKK